MLKRLNHIAIVVPDIKEAINKYTILEIYFKGNMQNIDKKK